MEGLAKKLSGGRTRIFLRSRKAGKFSPKSLMIYAQASPKFSTKTPQQLKIGAAGKACGAELRGKGMSVADRRTKMGACIRSKF
jgi:hypothetical protein